jgi:hypothetical protein
LVDDHNVPIFLTEVNKSGKSYQGMGVRVNQIEEHKEQWGKIIEALI